MLFRILLLALSPSLTIAQYSTCTDASLDYQGYTYNVDAVTSEKIWSHCKFPNPKFDHARCGLTSTAGHHWVCDPDYLISSQVDAVDLALAMIQTNTSTQCSGPDGEDQSYIVAVALINRIRIPDLQDSTTCINDCGEIQPTLNTTARSATSGELDAIMENFADQLRSGWGLGSCGNDVIILYAQDIDKIHVSVGYKASSLVTDSVVSKIESTFREYNNQGRLADGLLKVADDLRKTLRAITPAHIVLIMNMIVLVALGVFLVFFLHLRSVELNVWGAEKLWKIPEYLIYFFSGVWLIDATIFGVLFISNRAPFWAILIGVLMGVTCFLIYSFDDELFGSSTNSGKLNFTSA
ncbi:uncharacterized protein [Mytilus edulis]|uniref:uncharacterized protein n=1 Tax=Mytilus edulis TaxID=6550 RepID=UPI0039F0A6A2